MHHWGGHGSGGEQPSTPKTAQHAVQRRSDWAEDEFARRELGQIGEDRGDKVAETQLAGFHEIGHRVLGGLKCPDQRLANIRADIAGFAGVICQSRCNSCPPGCGSFCSGCSRNPRRFASRTRIVVMFYAESSLLALLAGTGGYCGGSLLAWWLGRAIFPGDGATAPLNPVLLPIILAVALVMALGGSTPSIRAALRLDPSQVLRGVA